ncbi:FAD-binding oxidoreductase [Microbacterium gallinarum]|uniref:FAD-binding protein n=1 Tax=Microbacterium gallinarum TaxID=2762209 RepID=A0ABR8X1A5_9MICO|nr:FAD-binding protein [Microbacterium gallinarum]MBD8022978.1 FAD-binding protein [Microbacterium gallinarum]
MTIDTSLPAPGQASAAGAASAAHEPVLPGEHFERLRAELSGDLVLPGEDGWDSARAAWQLLVDQHPAAVVVAADVHDVATTVACARRLGLHVAPQSTGHAAGALGPLTDTILLRTARLDGIAIDAEARTARVGAGVTAAALAAAVAEHGCAAVSGMAPSVGVVGSTLGGGLGWLARSHGLGVNSILSIDAVDAQGHVIRVDAEHHADLFWAVRGGIAPVIVTAIELQLHEIGELHAGALMWPLERAADVAHAWREWIEELPEAVTSLARVLRYPPIPEIPDFLRARSFVAVEAAIQADAATAASLLQPLRDLRPELDSVRPMSPAELSTVHGDPAHPAPGFGEAVVLTDITAASMDALIDVALEPSSQSLLSIELRHLGGRTAPGGTAGGVVSAIDGAGLVFAVGLVPFPGALAAVKDAATAVADRMQPFASSAVVKNFAERPTAAATLYGIDAERLRRVACAWDPEGVIRVGHPLDGPLAAPVKRDTPPVLD